MLQQIVENSSLDTEFRQQLLADPKTTISEELGIAIPDSITIEVHENDMRTVHLALPPDPNITEEQLQAISAGLCCCWLARQPAFLSGRRVTHADRPT